jgi:hypothetical protein
MRRHKLEVAVVGRGTDCGVVLDDGRFDGYLAGDVIQCVRRQAGRRK